MRGLFHHHSHNGEKQELADQNSHGSNRRGGFLRRYSASKANVHKEQNNPITATIHESKQLQQTAAEPTKVRLVQQNPDLPELAGNMENLRVMDEDTVARSQDACESQEQPVSTANLASESLERETNGGVNGNNGDGARS